MVTASLDLSTGDEAQQHDARIAPDIIPEVCQQLILRDATFYTWVIAGKLLDSDDAAEPVRTGLLQALPCAVSRQSTGPAAPNCNT
jgi:hypothetical protein